MTKKVQKRYKVPFFNPFLSIKKDPVAVAVTGFVSVWNGGLNERMFFFKSQVLYQLSYTSKSCFTYSIRICFVCQVFPCKRCTAMNTHVDVFVKIVVFTINYTLTLLSRKTQICSKHLPQSTYVPRDDRTPK